MRRIARVVTAAFLASAAQGLVTGSGVTVRAKAGPPTINLKALFYDTRNPVYRQPFGAVSAGTRVTFRLRTAHANVTAASLLFTQVDPSSGKKLAAFTAKMSLSSGRRYDTWTGTFTPVAIGLYRYYFRVSNGAAKAYYTSTALQEGGAGEASKSVPDVSFRMTAYEPTFKAPSWASDAVMYQIFPDRFYNGDPSNDRTLLPSPYGDVTVHQKWTDAPTGGFDFFGGDLQGIDDKLTYLKSLGVNVLYLNPIFLAPSNHKYDTTDYMKIDPHFGTQQTFDRLIADARAAGMRIILDGVFNHTGSDSIYFDRYSQFPTVGADESQASPYYAWYHFTQWPNSYDSFFGYDSLPTLQEVDPVKDFIFRKPDSVAQHWLSLGTSGWRLDAAHLKSHQWWQEFRQAVKKVYPDSIAICECDASPIDATPWLLGNELDGTMNYRFREALLGFFAHGGGTSSHFPLSVRGLNNALMSILEDYPKPAIMSSMNLVDSHDTDRVLTDLLGNKTVLREVATLQMTWLGIPNIYYGDETGLAGGGDPDDRRTFPWDSRDLSLEAYYTKIIAIRHANSALRDGSVTPVVTDVAHRTFGFLRKDSAQTVGVLINDYARTVTEKMAVTGIANGTTLRNVLGSGTYIVAHGRVTVKIPAHSSIILAK